MSTTTLSRAAVLAVAAAGLVGAAYAGTAISRADYSWVANESADICNSLYLQAETGGNWANLQISMLQMTQDVGRAEAVAGIRQAAVSYCPQHISAVPAR